MNYLIDTCVLSELRHPKGNLRVKKVFEEIDSDQLFISVISLGKIVKGIGVLADSKRKRELWKWLEYIENHYQDNVLNIDVETARIWGELTALVKKTGKVIHACDGLIAATAKKHGLHLMTRNTSDFDTTGVMLFNPWD